MSAEPRGQVWLKWFPQAVNALGWAVLGGLVVQRLLSPLFDPDLFWHLATGRWIVKHHAFLRSDIFSFPTLHSPWFNPEWLFQISVFLTEAFAGWAGIYCLKVVLAAGGIVLLGMTLHALSGGDKRWALPLVWMGFALLQKRLFERAELLTWICWGGLWLWIVKARKSPDQSWSLLWMVPLFLVWVNSHPGVVYGVGFIFLLCLGARWGGEPPSFVRRLDKALGVALCCLWANPYGWRMVLFYVDVMKQLKTNIGIIEEWKPPSLFDVPIFWATLAVVGALSVGAVLRKNAPWRWLVPGAFLFAVYGSQHVRSTALTAWTGLPMIAFAIREISKHPRVRVWGPVALTMVLAVTTSSPLWRYPMKLKWVAWSRLPKGAVEFMRQNHFQGRGYNEYGFGGYIQWVLGPELKTFLDGRYLSFPWAEEEMNLFLGMASTQDTRPWTRWSDRWAFDYAVTGYKNDFWDLWEQRSGQMETLFFDRLFPPADWALVYWDDQALIFCRRTGAFQSLIKRNEFAVLKPYLLVNGSVRQEDRERGAEEFSRHCREVPFSLMRSKIEKNVLRVSGTAKAS